HGMGPVRLHLAVLAAEVHGGEGDPQDLAVPCSLLGAQQYFLLGQRSGSSSRAHFALAFPTDFL
ncbi:unnamed protein product, partial [Prorocentrum cordatum]